MIFVRINDHTKYTYLITKIDYNNNNKILAPSAAKQNNESDNSAYYCVTTGQWSSIFVKIFK